MGGTRVLPDSSPLPVALALVVLLLSGQPRPSDAVKLKFRTEECMTHEVTAHGSFSGSFVALPDTYGTTAKYTLRITAPSGRTVFELPPGTEGRFSTAQFMSHDGDWPPVIQRGQYRLCLTMEQDTSLMDRDVMWDLQHSDLEGQDHVKEQDTQAVWDHVRVLADRVDMMKSTQTFMSWKHKRHRETVESTNRRLNYHTIIRCCTLLGVSIGQVLYIRRLFTK